MLQAESRHDARARQNNEIAYLVHLFVSWICLGIIIVQTAGCSKALRKDARWIRIGIMALLGMNVTSTALEFAYNLDRNVYHAGDKAWMPVAFKGHQARAIWYLCVSTVTSVQVFVVIRITEFSKAIYGCSLWRKAYTVALAALCLCTGCSGIIALHFRGKFPTFAAVQHAPRNDPYVVAQACFLFSSAFTDLVLNLTISVDMIYARRWQKKSQREARDLNFIFKQICFISIRNGFLGTLLSLTGGIMIFASNEQWSAAIALIIPRVYTICLLAYLRCPRDALRSYQAAALAYPFDDTSSKPATTSPGSHCMCPDGRFTKLGASLGRRGSVQPVGKAVRSVHRDRKSGVLVATVELPEGDAGEHEIWAHDEADWQDLEEESCVGIPGVPKSAVPGLPQALPSSLPPARAVPSRQRASSHGIRIATSSTPQSRDIPLATIRTSQSASCDLEFVAAKASSCRTTDPEATSL